ncbi:MAG: hypothetical protein BWK79_04605 [Beggiatoa sp. IS2]|nr:MAG: hypothetical protein BWK79_04605 [Beggiatoa sp. IS2]
MRLVCFSSKDLSLKAGIGAMGDKTKKVVVKLQLDRDVLEWYLKQGDDCQTYINVLLRKHMEAQKRQQINISEIEEIKRQLFKGFN